MLGAVAIPCRDPQLLAEFWTAATGGSIAGTHEGSIFIKPAPGGFGFFLQNRPDHQTPASTIHLDLTTKPGQREAEVERLVALGATRKWDVLDEVPWVEWTTLADPEGNLFCVASHNT
jgi:hypothetical protein